MSKVAIRENKKYIKTSRKNVPEKSASRVNITALAFHICRSKPKHNWTPKEVHYEMLKDGVTTKLERVTNSLRILSGISDLRIMPTFKRNELTVSYDTNRRNSFFKFNPSGTVRCKTTKALRTVTYNGIRKAEFVSK